MSENGKGDRQRPCDKQKFDDNFERIFGKTKFIGVDLAKGTDFSALAYLPMPSASGMTYGEFWKQCQGNLGIPPHLLHDTASANLACIAQNNPNFKAAVYKALTEIIENK